MHSVLSIPCQNRFSTLCLWCFSPAQTARETQLNETPHIHSSPHLRSIFQTCVEPARSRPYGECVYVRIFVCASRACCMCVFGMTWQPPALFKHGVGCAGSLIVRLGLPLVHAVPGTLRRGKEGAQQGQAASNTSPTEPKAPLVGLWTPEQAQGEMIMRTETVLHRITCRDAITGFKPHTHTKM